MIEPFAKDYTGAPFIFLGGAHLAMLTLLLLLNLSLVRMRRASGRVKDVFRIGLAVVLLVNEFAWHTWNWAVGRWTIQTMLPLHLCSVLVFLSAYMLLTKSYFIYEFAYFLGIGAAIQAVLTPDLGIYGFPHFRFFQTFISHGSIITAAVFMTVVEGFRPQWRSLARVLVWGNVYMVVITGINWLIGSNYLFTLHKPETPSLIDMLGPWPWYLLSLEAIAMLESFLLYLPFIVKDYLPARRRKFA